MRGRPITRLIAGLLLAGPAADCGAKDDLIVRSHPAAGVKRMVLRAHPPRRPEPRDPRRRPGERHGRPRGAHTAPRTCLRRRIEGAAGYNRTGGRAQWARPEPSVS